MHYWNRVNFQSLLELGKELARQSDLELLADYCLLREKGLRKQAFESLSQFLSAAALWSDEQARRNVIVILQANARTPEAHQFMASPLFQELIYPILEHWLEAAPTAHDPVRWLGLLRRDADLLRKALELDPADVVVRGRLIDFALDTTDYATHHLDESILLCPESEVRASISLARSLIEASPDAKPFNHYVAEVNEYEQMLNDWSEYQLTKTTTFPEWCQAKGRSYTWCSRVYYSK